MIKWKIDVPAVLSAKGLTRYRLTHDYILGNKTMSAIKRGEVPGPKTIARICELLSIDVEDLIDYVPEVDDVVRTEPAELIGADISGKIGLIAKIKIYETLWGAGYNYNNIATKKLLSTTTLTTLRRDNDVRSALTLDRLCQMLGCQPGDILTYISPTGGATIEECP